MTDVDALFNERPELQATDNQLANVAALMEEEHAIAGNIETHEAILADLKSRNQTIRQEELPQAMLQSGVAEFTCASTGTKAKLTFECAGALGSDPDERERKIGVLIGAGAEEIVKLELVVAFGKGEYDDAVQLSKDLAGQGFVCSVGRNIHPMTLKSCGIYTLAM